MVITCTRKFGELRVPLQLFAVADNGMIGSNHWHGYVPSKISSVYSMFLRRDGTISCKVTDS